MSVVTDKLQVTKRKDKKMSLEEMVTLIRKEWSDSMSDNGKIWQKTFNNLQIAKKANPDLYLSALDIARDKTNI